MQETCQVSVSLMLLFRVVNARACWASLVPSLERHSSAPASVKSTAVCAEASISSAGSGRPDARAAHQTFWENNDKEQSPRG